MIRYALYGLLLTCSLLLPGCKSDLESKEYCFKDLIDSEAIFNAADTTYKISLFNDFKIYNDSLAIFTDLFTYTIYKYDFLSRGMKKIGNIGNGPGEYLRPNKLFIKNDLIYYSDISSPGIECFDFNGKNPGKVDNKYLNASYIETFIIDENDNYYCIKNPHRVGYFVYSSDGNKYGKALPIFTNNPHGFPISGAYLNNNKLYFMYLIDSKIYSIDLSNNTEEQFKIKYKGFCDWDAIKNEKMTKKTIDNIREHYSSIASFVGFQFNGKTYFYIYAHNPENELLDKQLICNNRGEILFSIKDTGPYYLQSITENKSYAYAFNENEFVIKSFKWNKKFTDLLNNAE